MSPLEDDDSSQFSESQQLMHVNHVDMKTDQHAAEQIIARLSGD